MSMQPEIYATEEASNLVKGGMPFRDAYREVAKKYSTALKVRATSKPTSKGP